MPPLLVFSPLPKPTWHHECWAEGELLVLVEEVVWVAVEHHAPHRLQREHVLRPHLGHVQRVKAEPVRVFVES
jgi:hypothetical protein